MFGKMKEYLDTTLGEIRSQGLYKNERIITSPQGRSIAVGDGKQVINFCANNYLGLADSRELIEASCAAQRKYGLGLASVRFICGTQDQHKELEQAVSRFLGTEDTILYSSCFDANGGLFETLMGEEDAIISDELNHASIIDGVRLSKAKRLRYKHSDMKNLEECLKEAASSRFRIIATDGVFSMDGDIARLTDICDLAEKYEALVMVDDSHATGYIGATGRGTSEYWHVEGRVDVITTTFGKALGGASGGATSGRAEIVRFLRQRSRPYLFSNTLAPGITGSTLKAIELLEKSSELPDRVKANAAYFRAGVEKAGFDILKGDTAIVPVMIYDEPLAVKMADELLAEGIYVIGFTYPVVPKGRARIRTQLSAVHTKDDLDHAIAAFTKVGKKLGVLKK